MKIFALYLPQFHEIPENNEWWGEGFTEWTNVKKAEALFKNHVQPKHPLNDNYYNLLDKETVQWQTKVMKEYGISGMIYYHYYFCGKKLLEKPAENLLEWKEIDQPFFFCWANHSWNRAWRGSREVLLEQTYGNKSDWKEHFEYLLPFFRDKRYEKKDNKPLFMIYQADFQEKKEMLSCFDNWCKDQGFAGIYVIEVCFNAEETSYALFEKKKSAYTERYFMTEPLCGRMLTYYHNRNLWKKVFHEISVKLRNMGVHKKVKVYDGEAIYKTMMEKEPHDDKIIHGVFFEWDNTPRHGYRGYIITPPRKETFMQYMNKLQGDEYVFVNAWNEWAEGMVLEPSKELSYKYLEWIKESMKMS